MLGQTRSHPMSPMHRAFWFGHARDKGRASESRQKSWHSASGASTLLWWEVRCSRPCHVGHSDLFQKSMNTKNVWSNPAGLTEQSGFCVNYSVCLRTQDKYLSVFIVSVSVSSGFLWLEWLGAQHRADIRNPVTHGLLLLWTRGEIHHSAGSQPCH